MSAVRQDQHAFSFTRMQAHDLDDVLAIERNIYPWPWSFGNFLDSINSAYEAWILRDASGQLLGYFVLMMAVDDAHLLNITVRHDAQGQGIGQMLLNKAVTLARQNGMQAVLLEVRPSNQRALEVYTRYGFSRIGMRKGYHPAENGREDAIVMRFVL